MKTNLKDRHKIVRPIKKTNIKYETIKKCGYPITKRLWKTCINKNERNRGFNLIKYD